MLVYFFFFYRTVFFRLICFFFFFFFFTCVFFHPSPILRNWANVKLNRVQKMRYKMHLICMVGASNADRSDGDTVTIRKERKKRHSKFFLNIQSESHILASSERMTAYNKKMYKKLFVWWTLWNLFQFWSNMSVDLCLHQASENRLRRTRTSNQMLVVYECEQLNLRLLFLACVVMMIAQQRRRRHHHRSYSSQQYHHTLYTMGLNM